MNIAALSPLLIFSFTLPAIDTSIDTSAPTSPAPICAEFDLGGMRAGAARIDEPLGDFLRAELVSAANVSLEDMRAGSAPTDGDWGWIAIGAIAAVVLIVLL